MFPVQGGRLNSGLVLGDNGAILIDPGAEDGDLDALDSRVREAGSEVVVVALTHRREGAMPDLGRWPGAGRVMPFELSGVPAIAPETAASLFAIGWEALLYGPGRLSLYSPGERALFSGDMLSEAGIPDLRDGSGPYLESLAEVEKLDCRLVVPAAGPIAQGKRAARERIERDRGYVYSLLRHAQTSMAAPATLDRALEAARSVYEEYPFLDAHLDNLRFVWHEIQSQ